MRGAEVNLWAMPSAVDGRWHPWISAGLALGERELGWAMPEARAGEML